LNIFKPAGHLSFGAGLEVSLPEINKRLFLTIEATYNHNQYKGNKNGFNSSGTVRNNYTINVTAIKAPIGFRFNFSEKNFTPYLRTGLTPIIPLRYTWLIQEGGTTEARFNIKYKNTSLVIWGAFGFQRRLGLDKALSAELRIERYLEYIPFYGPSGTNNVYSTALNKMLVFGYRF
jgi:hypothetical protein